VIQVIWWLHCSGVPAMPLLWAWRADLALNQPWSWNFAASYGAAKPCGGWPLWAAKPWRLRIESGLRSSVFAARKPAGILL
jgi:hypothetical protein